MSARWKPGDVIEVDFPFYRSEWSYFGDEANKVPTWIPGALLNNDDYEAVMSGIARADGVGKVRFEVVATFKPGKKYVERIFYIRQWVDPSGKVFGQKRLRITTPSGFAHRIKGYRHPYRVAPEKVTA